MKPILHVIDASCDETQLQVLATLHQRLAADGFTQTVCCVDPESIPRAARHLSGKIHPVHRRLSRLLNFAPSLGQIARRIDAGLVHTWGIEAAAVAGAQLSELPATLTLLNPAAVPQVAGWLRSLPRDATISAGSQIIRARLISRGIAAERVVVIRGPADFAAINKARQTDLRQTPVGEAQTTLLMDGPASHGGGQYFGLWACAVVSKVLPGLRVILPYESKESRRLQRFIRQIGMTDMLIVPDAATTWPQLVACADVFMCPAIDEVCTEPLASAMAAGLPIVGSAVRSITEMIADKHNGLLCKPGDPRALASKLLTAIEDADLRRRITEVARGQAYEVFGIRDFADNYAHLYENVLANRPAAEGIRDTAMVA